MIYLGEFDAGDSVFYGANFHNDTGAIEDPTAPEAQQRTPAGVWSALTAPAKQNAKTGHYGGTIDTTGYASGQYIIRMAGTVATAKTVATEFCFSVRPLVEGALTLKAALRIILAAVAGKSTGGGTATVRYRDNADAKDRIVATVAAGGNRSSVTLDGSD